MPTTEFQRWLADRLDRIDDKVDERIDVLAEEIKTTRHAQRGSLETLTLQVSALVGDMARQAQDVRAINEWRSEGGPLDSRFRRHDKRLTEGESWRYTMRGALIAASLFVPIVTGVTVGVAVKLLAG
ncbi:MAG TPA: hypothetical protein VF156_15450 [Agromyces sp.]